MFSADYMDEVSRIAKSLDYELIEMMASDLQIVRERCGRVFVLGIGGSAGNASHMVNDLRKLCGIDAYAPTDNVSEITARTNDEGFDTIFEEYLKVSNFDHNDSIFVLSVGGGNKPKHISVALCNAADFVISRHGTIYGIVGKGESYVKEIGQLVIQVPELEPKRVTPHSEAFQSIIWHCLVSHPKLQIRKTTW